jgi:hypothetical protein
MSLNVCVVRLVSMVVYCLQLLVVCLQSSCDEHRGCVLLVVKWQRRVKCVCYFYMRAHTLNTKKICTYYQSCCRNEEVVTYSTTHLDWKNLRLQPGLHTPFTTLCYIFTSVGIRTTLSLLSFSEVKPRICQRTPCRNYQDEKQSKLILSLS